jgi:hypothetical protein
MTENNNNKPIDRYQRGFTNSTQDLRIAKEIVYDFLDKNYPQLSEENPLDLVHIFSQLLVYRIGQFLRKEGPFRLEDNLDFVKHVLQNVVATLYNDCKELQEEREQQGPGQ